MPQDHATIQAALDSLQDGDTVLVDVGLYAEALRGPARSGWVLKGNTVPDSGDYPRPVVDPGTLPRPDTVTCLILDPLSANVVIEDFVFRNGPAMYDTMPRVHAGGIVNNSLGLTMRRCVLDSTYWGVSGGTNLFLEACRFEWTPVLCARTDSGPIIASQCEFRSKRGWNVSARAGSRFSECEIGGNDAGHLFIAYGDSIVVEDCVFGPYGPLSWTPVIVSCSTGCKLRGNVFTDCQFAGSLLQVNVACYGGDVLPVEITNNVFMNYDGSLGQRGEAIGVRCYPGNASTYLGRIEDNVFMDGFSSASPYVKGNAITTFGQMDINRNRFTRLEPASAPDVYASRIGPGHPIETVTLRDNIFDPDGLAAAAPDGYIEARWNWWGDSTGPSHWSNPGGQGGEVGSGVDFDPWHTDTSFLYTPEPRVPLPREVELNVFPNPFNATATVKLRVPNPGIYHIDLFDTLGRHVLRLWGGAVADEKQIAVDGASLASGLYFVRAWLPIENRPAALQKLVLMK